MRPRKGVVLIIVLGVMVVLSILALVAVNLMTQESRVAEHKINRIRASYAAQAGYIDALERLRRGVIARPPVGAPVHYTINIGAGMAGYPAAGYTVDIWIIARGDLTNADPNLRCPATTPSDCCVIANADYRL